MDGWGLAAASYDDNIFLNAIVSEILLQLLKIIAFSFSFEIPDVGLMFACNTHVRDLY